MNSGLIANRYACAFAALVNAHGCADAVYEQVRIILSLMKKVPALRIAVTDARAVSMEKKCELLRSCVAPEVLQKEITDLLELMQRNSRSEFFRLTLLDYLQIYRQEHGLVMVQITTADQVDEELDSLVGEIMGRHSGKTAVVNHRVDPGIVGGFVAETWEYRLDASIKTALEGLKESLTNENTRLV